MVGYKLLNFMQGIKCCVLVSGMDDYKQEDLIIAAQQANAHDFIIEFEVSAELFGFCQSPSRLNCSFRKDIKLVLVNEVFVSVVVRSSELLLHVLCFDVLHCCSSMRLVC